MTMLGVGFAEDFRHHSTGGELLVSSRKGSLHIFVNHLPNCLSPAEGGTGYTKKGKEESLLVRVLPK